MITIHENFSEANGYRLANLLHLQNQNGKKVIIAVGDNTNWESQEPLPDDVISENLVEMSINEPQKAGEYWFKFFQHLILKSNLPKPKLWWLGFGKMNVAVNINNATTKNLVIQAIQKEKLNKRFVVS